MAMEFGTYSLALPLSWFTFIFNLRKKMWSPYKIGIAPKVRPLQTVEGVGDRLRLIAFAERQAHYAFLEAAERFNDAPPELIKAWKWIAQEERKHESWYLKRLEELKQDVAEIPVNLNLYHSFAECKTARDFAFYISDAEERGRVGAERFAEVLQKNDPETAKIFAQVAIEEREHVALAAKFFPSKS
jgi:uncharacterized ferritin-like protein (DUF455 family)